MSMMSAGFLNLEPPAIDCGMYVKFQSFLLRGCHLIPHFMILRIPYYLINVANTSITYKKCIKYTFFTSFQRRFMHEMKRNPELLSQLGPKPTRPKPSRPKTNSAQNQVGPKPTRPKTHSALDSEILLLSSSLSSFLFLLLPSFVLCTGNLFHLK